uniref:Uncharacterized protein n=1 Tax=Oncorhynchus mykiss TaxID=8022 RepID=A0A8C7NNK5_ONCMY
MMEMCLPGKQCLLPALCQSLLWDSAPIPGPRSVLRPSLLLADPGECSLSHWLQGSPRQAHGL